MSISALVLDDEYIIANDLARQIGAREDWSVRTFVNPLEAFTALGEAPADVCFVDIEMPGQNGLEFAARVRDAFPETLIIFVTAYSEFAAEAFRVRAFDYLVKPVARNLLREVCDSAEEALAARKIGAAPKVGRHIAVRSASRIDLVEVGSILFGQSLGNYISLQTPQKEYLHRCKISDMVEELAGHGFVRTHRSWFARASAVQSLKRKGETITALELDGGFEVPVSASHMDEVTEALREMQGLDL